MSGSSIRAFSMEVDNKNIAVKDDSCYMEKQVVYCKYLRK